MKWWPHQWDPHSLVQMGFLVVISVSIALIEARSTFKEKLDQVLVPQAPGSSIKCTECPCVSPCSCFNPCAQLPPPPPPPPAIPSSQYCCALAPPPPPPPRLIGTMSYSENLADLSDTDSSDFVLHVLIAILVVSVGLGVLLLWKWIHEKICTEC